MNSQEDKSDKKYQDYKKRIREIEEENDNISSQLAKARHHIKRLRVERIVLLEEIDELRQGGSNRARVNKKLSSSATAIGSSGLGGAGGGDSDSEMSVSESIISDVKGTRKNASATPRKKRDPNAPKGPGNVFFLYCRMERDNIKDEVPNESLGEVTRLLGQKWKALAKEEKQKYYDMYKREMDEYEEAMKNYTAAGGGLEGAAAVEAANKVKLEGEKSSALEMDDEEEDEEFDMLQDEEEDEDLAAEGVEEEEEILDDDDDEDMEEEQQQQPSNNNYIKVIHNNHSTSNQSTPMPETPNNLISNNTTPTNTHNTTTSTL